MSGIKVSLIATERNEVGAIAEFIESALAQSMKPDEIVIADGDSDDGTRQIIQRYIDQGAPVTLLNVPGNRSVGRNAAIEAARNEIIAVGDIGCRFDHDWLKHITQPFRDNRETQTVAGFFLAEPKTHFEKVSTDLMLQANEKVDVKTWLPSSRSIAFTKTAWRKAGRYPEYAEFEARLARKCGGEDTLFDLALKDAGYEFADGLKAIVYWRPRPDLKSFYLQYYWYAVGDGMDLTGLADHAFFRRLSTKYALVAALTLVLGSWWEPLGLLPLAYLGAGLGRRSLAPWRRTSSRPDDLLLMMLLLLVYDISQIFGYWYGFYRRPANKTTRA
ncbi:MAG TPA: glycosyltransferase [Candidatus Saccharimonadia bacterium]|nr:glycosyltransferase [Candidatus Saccharimonadia bacterium]